jgi:hypothetical protein
MTPKKITGDSIVKVNVRSVNVEIPARIDVRSGRDYGQFIEAVTAAREATVQSQARYRQRLSGQ